MILLINGEPLGTEIKVSHINPVNNLYSIELIANRWAWELVPSMVGGGPTEIQGTAGRFPQQPCELEPALQATMNQHCHIEGTSVKILT